MQSKRDIPIRDRSPWAMLESLQEEVGRWLDYSRVHYPRASELLAGAWLPPVDIVSFSDHVVVRMDVPGLTREDLEVHLVGSTLTIKGQKSKAVLQPNQQMRRNECLYGAFQRNLQLPSIVSTEEAKANCRDGVLEIIFGKRPEAEPKALNVQME